MKMVYSKGKEFLILLEGLVIFLMFHAIGGYWLAPMLETLFPYIPHLTIGLLSSSAVSPLATSIYLALRLKFIPKIIIEKRFVLVVIIFCFIQWVLYVIGNSIFGKEDSFAEEIFKTQPPYLYFNLFAVQLWGPVIEEILFSGYFLSTLRSKLNDKFAVPLYSLIFMIPHFVFNWTEGSVTFISVIAAILFFLGTVANALAYIFGGLAAAIIIHIFNNLLVTLRI